MSPIDQSFDTDINKNNFSLFSESFQEEWLLFKG